MKRMICRNKVENFDVWRPIFDDNLEAARKAGLVLENLWRSVEDPNEVFFIFKVQDTDSAKEFISSPSAEETGRRAGVIDGDCWFVE